MAGCHEVATLVSQKPQLRWRPHNLDYLQQLAITALTFRDPQLCARWDGCK